MSARGDKNRPGQKKDDPSGPAVSSADVARFRSLVTERFGLEFAVDKDGWLAEILRGRLRARREPASVYLAGAFGRDEARVLSGLLTVPETYFFRSSEQLRAFVMRTLDAASAPRQVRVLSAGCASGEEPYSLAILVRESAASGRHDVSIHAIDLNEAILARAREATYGSWALRETPDAVRARWFSGDGGGKQQTLSPQIRSMVTFEERNLAEEDAAFWTQGRFDVVFCRNVLMYFAPDVIRRIVARFARVLRPEGLLFLGHAETLRGVSDDFQLEQAHGTFFYVRRPVGPPAFARPRAALDEVASPLTQDIAGDWIDRIQRSSDRIAELGAHATAQASGAAEAAGASEASEARLPLASEPEIVASGQFDLEPTLDLLGKERFVEAGASLDALSPESSRDADVLLLRAVILTQQGDLVAARAVCGELLGSGEASAGAHFLTALCLETEADFDAAALHHRQASHLDPGFALPRLHLGRLSRKAGQQREARSHLERALALLEHEDGARLRLFGGGFGRDALLALCRAELEACERR